MNQILLLIWKWESSFPSSSAALLKDMSLFITKLHSPDGDD